MRNMAAIDESKSEKISLSGCTFDVVPGLEINDVQPHFSQQKSPMSQQLLVGPIGNVTRDAIPTHNGFLDAILLAYNNHHALILTPDDVWLAIMTQFSFFMEKNGETMREKFVSFPGQKTLVVKTGGSLATANWTQLCDMFSEKLVANIEDPSIREWVIPNFSTTTPTHRLAGCITLFSAMKTYFRYRAVFMCGIPKITIEGTVLDWEDIECRAKRLMKFDNQLLRQWYMMLAPILTQFTESVRGNVDINFWQRICKYEPIGSGGQKGLNGWASVFSVFGESGIWMGEIEKGFTWPNINIPSLATGICSVPISINDNGEEYNCQLLAGHYSYVICDRNALKPNVGWALIDVDFDKKQEIEKRKNLEHLKSKIGISAKTTSVNKFERQKKR